MKKVAVRNGAKRRGTAKRKRNAATTSTRSTANGRKRGAGARRKRRNGSTVPAGMMLVPKTAANGARRGRKVKRSRRNGVTRRNGILDNIGGVAKQVAFGGAGAIVTGVVANGVNSVVSPLVNKIGIVPKYVTKAGIEVAVAVVPVKMLSEKLLSRQNSDAVVAGGVIKAAITLANGLMPDVLDYNPLNNAKELVDNVVYDLGEPYEETNDFAGAMDGYEEPIYNY